MHDLHATIVSLSSSVHSSLIRSSYSLTSLHGRDLLPLINYLIDTYGLEAVLSSVAADESVDIAVAAINVIPGHRALFLSVCLSMAPWTRAPHQDPLSNGSCVAHVIDARVFPLILLQSFSFSLLSSISCRSADLFY